MEIIQEIQLFFLNFATKFSDAFVLNFIKDDRYMVVVNGLILTINISICTIILGVILGCVTTFLRRSRFKALRAIGYVYVDIIRGTPAITQLIIR